MGPFCRVVHKYRRNGVMGYLCAGGFAGRLQAGYGIVYNKFFSEYINKMFGAPADFYFVRVGRSEYYGVAYQVAPQAAVGSNYHGIVHAGFNGFYRVERSKCAGLRFGKLAHRDKFVEYAFVNKQQQARVCRVVLYSEEPFRGIVGFHVVHLLRRNELLVLLPVGHKADAPMHE